VVPHRIYSLAVHPMENKLLVAVGDKWGNLGMYSVTLTGLMITLAQLCICVMHMLFRMVWK